MLRKPAWWDQNIGDWIDQKIEQWKGSNRDDAILNNAHKHLNARRDMLNGYTLPPGYEMEVYHRSWYGAETNIWVRSASEQDITGEKKNEQESAAANHEAAMNDAFSKNNAESAKEAAERMTQTENHDKASGAKEQEPEQSNSHEHERQQAQNKDKEQGLDHGNEHER